MNDTRYDNGIIKRRIIAVVAVIIFAIALYLAFGVFACPMLVEGESMDPTLKNGEFIFVQKAFYQLNRGDIAVFQKADGKRVIKRVIAVGGDRIDLRADGVLYINGEKTEEPYVEHYAHGEKPIALTLKEGEYFVMGDNRANSEDSRKYGVLREEQAVGKKL